jgi:hypothetical protein
MVQSVNNGMNGRAGEYVLNTPNANMCSVLIRLQS